MNEEKLCALLSDTDVEIIVKADTASTNTDAKLMCDSAPSRPVLITADSQHGGRGRQGKSFISPAGGLYMSLLMPTDMPLSQAIGATSCAAVAVRRAIFSASGANCGIKWINDLYLSGGKLCGILAESVNDYTTMTSRYLVIGVGINIESAPNITDSAVRAVSLRDCEYDVSREVLCAEVVRELIEAYTNGFDFARYAEEYRSNSILLGHEISFTLDGAVEHGIAEDITDSGALVVRCNGKTLSLDSGEVSVRIR